MKKLNFKVEVKPDISQKIKIIKEELLKIQKEIIHIDERSVSTWNRS